MRVGVAKGNTKPNSTGMPHKNSAKPSAAPRKRMGCASLLARAGLPDLVAGDDDAYVEIAGSLARDVERRKALPLVAENLMTNEGLPLEQRRAIFNRFAPNLELFGNAGPTRYQLALWLEQDFVGALRTSSSHTLGARSISSPSKCRIRSLSSSMTRSSSSSSSSSSEEEENASSSKKKSKKRRKGHSSSSSDNDEEYITNPITEKKRKAS